MPKDKQARSNDHEKIKDAVQKVMDGNINPLDNYDLIKESIKQDGTKAVEMIWGMLDAKIKSELEKDEECKKAIDEYKKDREQKVKDLGKESVAYRFSTYHDFEEWKAKQKKPYTPLTRHIIFVYEALYPIIYENMDVVFDHMKERAENCMVSRMTTKCPKCDDNMVFRSIKEKYVCDTCSHIESPENVNKKELRPTETVGVDLRELPVSDVYGSSWVVFLEKIIKRHVEKEIAAEKKIWKSKDNS